MNTLRYFFESLPWLGFYGSSAALNLFYLEEYSVEEVSDLTGWSVSNVKVILHRARKSMYCELNKMLKTEKKLLY